MLYFSKLKIFSIYFIIITLSFFSLLNFLNTDENFFLSKKIKLGLDLQGGSYLLLEVNSQPIINQNLQQKLLNLRKYLKKNEIKYNYLNLLNQSRSFNLSDADIKKFVELFLDKNNEINLYYSNF